jgi:hypothetical protein
MADIGLRDDTDDLPDPPERKLIECGPVRVEDWDRTKYAHEFAGLLQRILKVFRPLHDAANQLSQSSSLIIPERYRNQSRNKLIEEWHAVFAVYIEHVECARRAAAGELSAEMIDENGVKVGRRLPWYDGARIRLTGGKTVSARWLFEATEDMLKTATRKLNFLITPVHAQGV